MLRLNTTPRTRLRVFWWRAVSLSLLIVITILRAQTTPTRKRLGFGCCFFPPEPSDEEITASQITTMQWNSNQFTQLQLPFCCIRSTKSILDAKYENYLELEEETRNSSMVNLTVLEQKGKEEMRRLNDIHAFRSANLSNLIYGDAFGKQEMTAGSFPLINNSLNVDGFEFLYASRPTGDQIPLFMLSRVHNVLYLTFRGTKSAIDWLVDLGAGERWLKQLGGFFHGGMTNVLCNGHRDDTLRNIARKVEEIAKQYHDIDTLVLTGHSLGGGYALIAGACFLGEDRFHELRSRFNVNIHVRTYGAPQVMSVPDENKQKEWWKMLQKNTNNYVHNDDLVPRLTTPTWTLEVIPETALDFVRAEKNLKIRLLRWAVLPLDKFQNFIDWIRQAVMKYNRILCKFQPVGKVIFLSLGSVATNSKVLLGEQSDDKTNCDLQLFIATGQPWRGSELLNASEVLNWFPYQPERILTDHYPSKYTSCINLYERWNNEGREAGSLHFVGEYNATTTGGFIRANQNLDGNGDVMRRPPRTVQVAYGKFNNILRMQDAHCFENEYRLKGSSTRTLNFQAENDGEWVMIIRNSGSNRRNAYVGTVTHTSPVKFDGDLDIDQEHNSKAINIDPNKRRFRVCLQVHKDDLIRVSISPKRGEVSIKLVAMYKNCPCIFKPSSVMLTDSQFRKLLNLFNKHSEYHATIPARGDSFRQLCRACYPLDYELIMRKAGHTCAKCNVGSNELNFYDVKHYLMNLAADGPNPPNDLQGWIDSIPI